MNRTPTTAHTETQTFDHRSNRLMLEVARTAWTNSVLLIVLSTACLLVFAPFVVAASIFGWAVVWAPMVLAAAPFWLVIIVASNRLLDGYGVTLRDLPGLWRSGAAKAWSIALVPAASGAITLGLLERTQRGAHSNALHIGLLIALGVSIAVAMLTGPTMVAAGRYDLGWGVAWTFGARWLVAAPVSQLGLLVCFGMLGFLAMKVGPVCLLGVGPLGLLSVGISRESTRSQGRSDQRITPPWA